VAGRLAQSVILSNKRPNSAYSYYLLYKTINEATDSSREYHVSDIWLALAMYPDNIYLQLLGQFKQDRSPSQEILKEYAAAYFMMDIKILPPGNIGTSSLTTRLNLYTQNRQILTSDILRD
jgi:hypothetical protein